jgi:hypothetical protein
MPRNGVGGQLRKLFARGDQAILQWTERVQTSFGLWLEEHHNPSDPTAGLLAALKRVTKEREKAIGLITLLVRERTEVRRLLDDAGQRSGLETTYRAVGLDPNCPAFLLKAARTAHRKRWHPDTQPGHLKAAAHRRFVQAEEAFERLFAERKL